MVAPYELVRSAAITKAFCIMQVLEVHSIKALGSAETQEAQQCTAVTPRPTGAPESALQEQLAGLRRKAAYRRVTRRSATVSVQGEHTDIIPA